MTDSPLEAAGLGAAWAPAPLGYSFGKMTVPTPDGPQPGHLLIIDGPTGRQAFAFDADSFRVLGEKIIAQTTGIQIVRDHLPPPNGQHRP